MMSFSKGPAAHIINPAYVPAPARKPAPEPEPAPEAPKRRGRPRKKAVKTEAVSVAPEPPQGVSEEADEVPF